jgi:hypothetical protein
MVRLEAATGRAIRTKENLQTTVFHEKALFVKANVVAITLERVSSLPCRHASIRTLFESILWDLVHDGVRLFGPTLQSQNRSPSERGTKTIRAVAGTGRWQSTNS